MAHPEALETHPGVVGAHPGTVEAYYKPEKISELLHTHVSAMWTYSTSILACQK